MTDVSTERLVSEALAKSGLLWVSSPAGSAPVWHVAEGTHAYVVSGPDEQFSPEHDGRAHVVTRSKESRARLLSFDADVTALDPAGEEWASAAASLAGSRLNAPAGDTVARWREHNRIVRITANLTAVTLRGELLPAPGSVEETSDESAREASQPSSDESPRPTERADAEVTP